MLPNFLHIGSAKSGSTWLWEVCKEHPEIYTPSASDNPNFFTVHYHRGLDWYERTYFANVGQEKAVVDFSNSYLVFAPAIERVARHLPDARLTVTLRNPIDRCYFSWAAAHFQGRYGFAPTQGIGIPFERLLHPNGTSYFRAWVEPGFYAHHLKRVLSYFPRERMLIMLFDDLAADNAAFLKAYFEFLGVDPAFKTTLIKKDINPDTSEAHEGFGMTPAMREELYQAYKEDISQLEEMLGRDLSHWK